MPVSGVSSHNSAGTDIAPSGHAVPATFLQRQEAARAEANRIHARSRDLVRAARRFLADHTA
jgi:hypothetical protein